MRVEDPASEPARYCSWNRFNTPNLTIAAALVGATHAFLFNDKQARVTLPPASATDGDDPRLKPTTWIYDRVVQFGVRDVDVRVDQPTSPALTTIVSAADPTEVNTDLITQMGEFALRTFEHWLRVLRWRTRAGNIGRLGREQRVSWGTYLHERETDKRIASGVTTIVVRADHRVTEEHWVDVQRVLIEGRESPLFFDLFFEGQTHFADGDLRRAVIDCANAAEVMLKTLVDAHCARTELHPRLRRHLVRAPARVLLNNFGEALLGSDRWNRIGSDTVKTLRLLFESRNAALHDHSRVELTERECRPFVKATGELLEAGAAALDQMNDR